MPKKKQPELSPEQVWALKIRSFEDTRRKNESRMSVIQAEKDLLEKKISSLEMSELEILDEMKRTATGTQRFLDVVAGAQRVHGWLVPTREEYARLIREYNTLRDMNLSYEKLILTTPQPSTETPDASSSE